MGLFGLFAMMVGLGAMAKDDISRSIASDKARDRALNEGRSWYLGADGKYYDSDTNKRVFISYHTGRAIMTDSRTGKPIEDLTLTMYQKREAEEKQKAKEAGCVFYKKYTWDTPSARFNVWVSDTIPGYFSKLGYDKIGSGKCKFEKGSLVEARKNGINGKEVKPKYGKEATMYYEDGTPYMINGERIKR